MRNIIFIAAFFASLASSTYITNCGSSQNCGAVCAGDNANTAGYTDTAAPSEGLFSTVCTCQNTKLALTHVCNVANIYNNNA